MDLVDKHYQYLKHPDRAKVRDLVGLLTLKALKAEKRSDGKEVYLYADLTWPSEITESEFMERIKQLPNAQTYPFLNP